MITITGWALRIGGVVGILWLVGMTLLVPPAISPHDDPDPKIVYRLRRAVHELDILKKQNNDIKIVLQDFTKQIKELGNKSPENKDEPSSVVEELQKKLDLAKSMLQNVDNNKDTGGSDIIPSLEFEKTRRSIGKGIRETWWFLKSQLDHLKQNSETKANSRHIDYILSESWNHLNLVEHDLKQLSELDGLREWRERESSELSNLVQKRLHTIQNPPDCSQANKLVCNINKGCGYGCQIHHVVYCFIMAYGSNRTLILKSKGWRYNKNGWEDVFLPLSDTCNDPAGASHSHWPGSPKTQVVDLPIIDTLAHRPNFLPLAIPKDLSDRIIRLHGNPSAWWIAQFLKYMLRPQHTTKAMLDSLKQELGFEGPIVGLHIRRTDKVGTEAAFHTIDEYMEHAKDYFKSLALSGSEVSKRVYIASDDPTVLLDARKKFPDFTFYGDPNIAKTAAVSTRYSDVSLKGIIADIHFLSLTDYIVCTFSSQVCRIAYEIMQIYHPDASNMFRSLDDIYYYGGQGAHNQKARFAHTPKDANEMELKVGDVVGIAGNHWDGFSKGVNRRTRQTALFPSYKMEEVIDLGDTPIYNEIDHKKVT